MLEIFLKGLLVSGSLIIAIGSQNAFVLKQALLKEHIFYVCAICFLFDFILMSLGVMGLGTWISKSPNLTKILALGGSVFLIYYGTTAFISAYKAKDSLNASLISSENKNSGLTKVLLSTLAVTLLNPHVYLDTVVIIGGVAGTLNRDQKIIFLTGSITASFIWFFSLGYGVRLLSPLFKKKSTWKVFNFIIGCIMFFIAGSLVVYALK
ncbi:MAG: LysE/ArgO family amino acid transporter [Tenacibaculum sp.]